MVLKEQSPKRLYEVRGKLYELLVNCIPPELVLRRLALELLPKLDDELKHKAVEHAAFFEHRLQARRPCGCTHSGVRVQQCCSGRGMSSSTRPSSMPHSLRIACRRAPAHSNRPPLSLCCWHGRQSGWAASLSTGPSSTPPSLSTASPAAHSKCHSYTQPSLLAVELEHKAVEHTASLEHCMQAHESMSWYHLFVTELAAYASCFGGINGLTHYSAIEHAAFHGHRLSCALWAHISGSLFGSSHRPECSAAHQLQCPCPLARHPRPAHWRSRRPA